MRFLWYAAALVTPFLLAATLAAQSLDVQLQRAVQREMATGDHKAAIAEYKRIALRAESNTAAPSRALAAQALLHLAKAYRQLGDTEAQRIYQRLVREFTDQKDVHATAMQQLNPAVPRGIVMKEVGGIDGSGNISADGRLVAVVNWATGNIAVHDMQRGTTRDLTRREDYDVYDPVISRDGRYVAYQSFNGCIEQKPFRVDNGTLCVLAVLGEPAVTPRTVIARDDIKGLIPMDWSPDGRSIAVTVQRQDGSAQIGIVSVADGSLAVLHSVDWRGPTRTFFSPDGRFVAFDVPVDDSSDQRDIRVVSVDGSQGGAVVVDPGQDVVMGWSPNGTHLLFASDRAGAMGLWAQRITKAKAEGTPRLIHGGLGGAYSLGVTTSGALYWSVQSGGRDVEVLTIDQVSGKQIGPAVQPIKEFVGTNFMPEWSRDGRLLAYASSRGFAGNTGFVLGIRDTTTNEVRELRPRFSYFNQLSWAPDNSRLATSGIDLKGRRGAFVVDAASGDAVFVAEGINPYPKWSLDGERLFYRKANAGPADWLIVERDLRSGTERTIAKGELANFSVSPDGRWLAVASGGVLNGTAKAVVLVSIATGETRELFRAAPGERIPVWTGLPWTPDSNAVMVRKVTPEPGLWLVPIAGAPAQKIDVDISGWGTGPFGVISLHPDGRQLAGTRWRDDGGSAVRVLENFLSALK